MTTRWQSWHAAFEEAGKLGSGDPAHHNTISLTLTPSDFAAALGDLGRSLPFDEHQRACRNGALRYWDPRGRSVEVVREGSVAERQAARLEAEAREESTAKGRITLPPELEGAELGSLSYAGNLAVSAPPPASGIVAAVKSVLPKGKKK